MINSVCICNGSTIAIDYYAQFSLVHLYRWLLFIIDFLQNTQETEKSNFTRRLVCHPATIGVNENAGKTSLTCGVTKCIDMFAISY